MNRKFFFTTLSLCLVLGAPQSWAGSVIVNPALTLSMDEVGQIYLGDMQSKGSTHLVPIDNSAEQANFVDKVLKTDVAKYQSRWTKKAFRDGLNPPPVNGSDAEVVNFVKSNPGGVGYIAGSAPAGVKVVASY